VKGTSRSATPLAASQPCPQLAAACGGGGNRGPPAATASVGEQAVEAAASWACATHLVREARVQHAVARHLTQIGGAQLPHLFDVAPNKAYD
jgi:hypothetical protein